MKKKWLWIVVILLLLLLVVYGVGSWYFSDILINRATQTVSQDQARMDDHRTNADLPPDYGLPQPEVVHIDAGEVSLAGHYYENARDGDCAVLLLHGYTGTRYGGLPYGSFFWERGCHLLAYDARGHGESSNAYHTYGYHEKQDGEAALNWLSERAGLRSEQIGLAGVSYGASTSIQMVPLTPDIAFVLADSPYQDLSAIVKHQAVDMFGDWVSFFVPGAFFISEWRADFDAAAVSPMNAVAKTSVPILLIHSQQDEFTPSSHSEAIYAHSNPATTALYLTDWGAPHGGSIFTDYETYSQIVDEFMAVYAPEFGLSDGR